MDLNAAIVGDDDHTSAVTQRPRPHQQIGRISLGIRLTMVAERNEVIPLSAVYIAVF
jgi:hypothetical protein